MPRAPTVLAALAVAGLLAAALGPLAEADHVYSHRYLLRGRVVDAAGDPVPRLGIPFGFTGFSGGEACPGSIPQGLTDAYGDFVYCFHLHDLDEEDAISIAVKGREHRAPVDLDTRGTTFLVRLDEESDAREPPADFRRAFRVDGKVWQRAAPGYLDGVWVTGVALEGVNVTVRARDDASGAEVWANGTTDAYGEYRVRLDFPANATGGLVTVDALNETREAPLDATFMRARVDVKLDGNATRPEIEPGERHASIEPRPRIIANFPDNDRPRPPGSEAPVVTAGTLVFVAIAGAGGLAGFALWARARKDRDE